MNFEDRAAHVTLVEIIYLEVSFWKATDTHGFLTAEHATMTHSYISSCICTVICQEKYEQNTSTRDRTGDLLHVRQAS